MPFCPKCGSEAQGQFCAKCGSAIATAPPPPAAPPPPGGQGYPPPPPAQPGASGLTDNLAAALCYLLGVLTGVLFLVLEPYNHNRLIRFHAFQAIFFWGAAVVASIAFSLVASIIQFLPFVGWIAVLVLWPAFGLAILVVWIMLMYKAYNNERWVLPVIGPIAEKQAYAG